MHKHLVTMHGYKPVGFCKESPVYSQTIFVGPGDDKLLTFQNLTFNKWDFESAYMFDAVEEYQVREKYIRPETLHQALCNQPKDEEHNFLEIKLN